MFICISVLALLAILLTPRLVSAQEETVYDGIDVSEWQGMIDFQGVKDSGTEVVYIRTGAGTDYKDPNLERNYLGFRNAGMKIGFYHYVTALSVEEAIREAEFFVSLTENKTHDACMAMDFEYFYGLADSTVNEIAAAFMRTVEEKSGLKPCVYSDSYNAQYTFKNLNQYPLWVADYYRSEPQYTGQWQDWAGFQYTDRGVISGIEGDVDRDYFKNSILLNEPSRVPPQNLPAPVPRRYINYNVKSGDTLSQIARKFDTTVAKIAAINELKNPDMIYTNEVLKIDIGEISPDGSLSYTVREGDTLESIAERYNTTVDYLLQINNLQNPQSISPGDVIKV